MNLRVVKTRRTVGGFLLSATMSGCALLGRGDAIGVRYFTPEPPAATHEGRADAPFELRLGSVVAASYLGERIAYRLSENELGFYDDRRWAEKPEEYLARALVRALFQDRPGRRIVSGPGPRLDVELLAFDEVRGAEPRARVRLGYAVSGEHAVLREGSFTVERPVRPAAATDPAAWAHAMGEALQAAVGLVAGATVAVLAPSPP